MLALLAIVVGVVLAVLLMIPFIALSYRRRGGITFWRSLGWLALLVYVIAVWSYTLLPVPDSPDYPAAGVQLDPMDSVRDIRSYAHGTVRELLGNEAVQQLVLNVILFMPLGFLIRTLFRRGIFVATLTGFALSMFIELTQLTAVWGLFPRPYRVFDVGDLMTNTAGALLGSMFAFVFVGFARREERFARGPGPVTAGRRFLGMFCDYLFVSLLGWVLAVGVRLFRAEVLGVPVNELGTRWDTVTLLVLPLVIQFGFIMLRGVSLGESAVLLSVRYRGIPVVLSRLLRFAFGIGGYMVLMYVGTPVTTAIAGLLVIASVIAVWATRDRRGLASAIAGSYVVDAREPDERFAPRAPRPERIEY